MATLSEKMSGIGMTSARTRARMIERLREQGIRDEVVLAAMSAVPRHIFVDEALAMRAYDDSPLPIGHGQTISQPYIVASMTDLLGVRRTDKVLEIGTGSGYQTAVLAQLGLQVYSMEIVEPLAKEAAARLKELGYHNVEVRAGDGYRGWPEQAPFDRIIVTAAPPELPRALIQQLKNGGRMVAPVGREWQELVVVDKDLDGHVRQHTEYPVIFVPMVPAQK